MKREADILKQRIKPGAFGRRLRQALKRIRREQQKCVKAKADKCLPRERGHQRFFSQPLFHQRDHRAADAHDRDPHQHRAFVVAPCARQLEDERFGRVTIFRDKLNREIG